MPEEDRDDIDVRPPVPDALRDKLAPVVLDIYSADDFHHADMRTVARESGTSFRTLYKYFGDKESLLFWFIDYWLDEVDHAPWDESVPVRDQLLAAMQRHFAYYERNPKVAKIIYMTVPMSRWMQYPGYARYEIPRKTLEVIRKAQASGKLRADLSPVAILDVFVACFSRTVLMWEYRGRKYSLLDQAESVMEILWDGMAPRLKPARKATRAPQ